MTSDYLFSIKQWRHKTKFLIVTLRKRVWVCVMLLKTHMVVFLELKLEGLTCWPLGRRSSRRLPSFTWGFFYPLEQQPSSRSLWRIFISKCVGWRAWWLIWAGTEGSSARISGSCCYCVSAFDTGVIVQASSLEKQVSSFSILTPSGAFSAIRLRDLKKKMKRALWSVYSEKSADVV